MGSRLVLPFVTPMEPTLVRKPFHHEDWVYEERYDGWPMLAYKHGRQVRVVSRLGRDHTDRFPELAAAIAAVAPPTLILDGEVARFDETLVSRNEWPRRGLPNRLATSRLYMAFDCLYLAGRDLRKHPLRGRRNWLEDVLEGQQLLFPHVGWPQTASRPGPKSLSAATRVSWQRTLPGPTSAVARWRG